MFILDELKKEFAPLIAQEIISQKEEKQAQKDLKAKMKLFLEHLPEQPPPVALHLKNDLTVKMDLGDLPNL